MWYVLLFHHIHSRLASLLSQGAGNSVFPLLSENANPDLIIHAYDYSSHAVKLVQVSPQASHPTFVA